MRIFSTLALTGMLLPASAFGFVDPKCAGEGIPGDYDEQVQQDFLQNYPALATSFSGVHGPIPHEAGRGMVGVHVGVIPPLGCQKRFVLNGTKTEDTNKSPAVPRITATYAFPELGPLHIYAGMGYTPPVPIAGTTNAITSAEIGVGVPFGETGLSGGLRFHSTLAKIVGEIATPFVEGDPAYDDFYVGSTFGFDALFGYDIGQTTPFVTVGFMDASTYFFIGDDAWVGNNLHPYAGMTFSAGVDTLIADRLRLGAEFYGAPGGYSTPDPNVTSVDAGSRYGNLYTGRMRVGLEL